MGRDVGMLECHIVRVSSVPTHAFMIRMLSCVYTPLHEVQKFGFKRFWAAQHMF